MQVDELDAGLGAELGVEVGQRLVHQERVRPADDGPGQRDSLALAAREGPGLAAEQLVEPEDPSRSTTCSWRSAC